MKARLLALAGLVTFAVAVSHQAGIGRLVSDGEFAAGCLAATVALLAGLAWLCRRNRPRPAVRTRQPAPVAVSRPAVFPDRRPKLPAGTMCAECTSRPATVLAADRWPLCDDCLLILNEPAGATHAVCAGCGGPPDDERAGIKLCRDCVTQFDETMTMAPVRLPPGETCGLVDMSAFEGDSDAR